MALAEPIVVTIEALDVAAAPGSLPMLRWKVTGPSSGLSVEVRAHPPRAFAVPALAALTPGPLMPGEQSIMLMTMPVAPTGELALVLPEATQGLWSFDVVLHDDASRVVAFDSRMMLISSTPELRLAVDRVAAAPTQPIQASVTLAAGAQPRPIRVVATRTEPDNSVHTLALDSVGPVFDATSENVKLPLFGGALTMLGVHRLDVMMFDAATGEALSAAHAEITVCDQLTPTSIIVRAGGTAVSGVAVRFLDVGTGHAVESGTSDAAGAVTASLPAGSYVAITDELVVGGVITVPGCGAPTIGNGDIIATTARRRAREPGTSLAVVASAVRTRIVLVRGPGVPLDPFGVYLELVQTAIGMDPQPISTVTTQDIASMADWLRIRMAMGGDENAASILEEYTGQQALIVMDVTRAPGHYLVSLGVVVVESGEVRRVQLTLPESQINNLDLPDRLLALFKSTVGSTVNAYIFDHLVRPLVPSVKLRPLAGETLAAGSTQTLQADLVDVDSPGIPMGNKPLTLVHMGQRVTANTDANGTATFTFQVPSTLDPRPIELYAEFHRFSGPVRSNSQFYKVEDVAGRLRVFTGAARVRPGSNLAIGAQVRKLDGTPESGVSVTLTINLGGLATVVTEVTGVDGLVGTTAPVGRGEGLGVIEARIAPDVRGQAYVMVASGAAVALTTSTLAVVTGVAVGIDGVATRDGAPIAGQHVDLTVTGGGTLSATSAVCDTHGRFHVDWTAPAGTGIATIHVSTTIDGDGVSADQQLAYCPTPPVTFPADRGRWLVRWQRTNQCGDHDSGTAVATAEPGDPFVSPPRFSGIISFFVGGGGLVLPRTYPSLAGPFSVTSWNDDPTVTQSFSQAADFTVTAAITRGLLACGKEAQIRTSSTSVTGVRLE